MCRHGPFPPHRLRLPRKEERRPRARPLAAVGEPAFDRDGQPVLDSKSRRRQKYPKTTKVVEAPGKKAAERLLETWIAELEAHRTIDPDRLQLAELLDRWPEATRGEMRVASFNSYRRMYRDGMFLARTSGSISNYDYSDTGPQGLGQKVLDAVRTSATFPKPPTGGALINAHGRLIGVMGHLVVNGGQPYPPYNDSSTAVATSKFKDAVAAAQASLQQLPATWLGVGSTTAGPDLGPAIGARGGRGLLVEFVVPGSPADKAGITGGTEVRTVGGEPHVVGGDVIVGIDGAAVRSADDLPSILGGLAPGDVVSFRLLRRGTTITLKVTLAPNPLGP